MKPTYTSICIAGILCTHTAFSASVINTTGLASPNTTLTFDEWGADGVLITNQYSAQGVVLTPMYTLNSDVFPALDLWALNSTGADFEIQFQGTVDEAAFGLITNPGTSTFTALLSNTIVEQFSAPTDYLGSADYFGFTGITFDTIRVSPGGDAQAFRMDNLQYGLVTPLPEPSYSLLVVAIGSFTLLQRRRR